MRKIAAVLLMLVLLLGLAASAQAYSDKNLEAPKAGNVVIDGDLGEWDTTRMLKIDSQSQIIDQIEHWDGEADCSMEVYAMWDEENLYMAADVTEDTPLGAIEMLPVDGEDNLMLFISTDPTADPDRQEYGTNDFMVYFIMDEGYWDTAVDRSMVPKDNRQRYVSVGMDGGENVLEGYTCAIQMTATGFIWEAVIPWSCFSNKKIEVYTPAVGDTLLCDFAITDISYPCPGTEYIPQLAWTGSQKINTNPSLWGTVTLAE